MKDGKDKFSFFDMDGNEFVNSDCGTKPLPPNSYVVVKRSPHDRPPPTIKYHIKLQIELEYDRRLENQQIELDYQYRMAKAQNKNHNHSVNAK